MKTECLMIEVAGKVVIKPDRSAVRSYGIKEFAVNEFRWIEKELKENC
jgi:hypothetical protein